MGSNIHVEVDIYEKEKLTWHHDVTREHIPFQERWYRLFAFLADVRNEEGVPSISSWRGVPDDRLEEAKKQEPADPGYWFLYEGDPIYNNSDYYGFSWVLLSELLDYDYDKSFFNIEDKQTMTVREFLDYGYFESLAEFKKQCFRYAPEDVRLFFYFDN